MKIGGKNMKLIMNQFRISTIWTSIFVFCAVLIAMNASAQFNFNSDLDMNFIGIMESKDIIKLGGPASDNEVKKDLDSVFKYPELMEEIEEPLKFEEWMMADRFVQSEFNLEDTVEVEEDELVIEDWMIEFILITKEQSSDSISKELGFKEWMMDESYWSSE